jgi:hypothetical protein
MGGGNMGWQEHQWSGSQDSYQIRPHLQATIFHLTPLHVPPSRLTNMTKVERVFL